MKNAPPKVSNFWGAYQILAHKSSKQYESEKKTLSSELRKSEMRIEMLPKLLKTLYEDKVDGKTSEEDYNILSREYANEREQLKKKILSMPTSVSS